jgi:hypothetical protein
VSKPRSVGSGFIKAAHYFGLSRYGWPINYLNAVELGRLDADFKQIAADGFNAIVLLIPWGELQPGLGRSFSYDERVIARRTMWLPATSQRSTTRRSLANGTKASA